MSKEDNNSRLLVLDLDETLVHATEQPLTRPADLRVDGYHIHTRPGAEAFLREVGQLYALAVWSSAGKVYVETTVAELFSEVRFEFIWSQERCTMRYDGERMRRYWVKDLKKVKRRGWPLERVLIVDDQRSKCERDYGNAIHLRPYRGATDDDELPRLGQYLRQIHATENFRRLEKRTWRDRLSARSDATGGR
jgi:RNA polymerase II subunit A small phosphatase-like protein